ncbi:MAG TPA: nuclear transport factor 2 family protein [Candidatus Acidoferrum sp.]|nr:nuclear transport factor 2 family protein [Candidatus Acidoferrum sp.]
MRQGGWWPKINFVLVLALFATIEGETAAHMSVQQFARPAFCSGPEYRQLDFWLGDWDTLEAGKAEVVARTRVDRILDGCVLREDYESAIGLKGQSFSLYDASRRIWHQSWATNKGRLLTIEGRLEDGAMVLAGTERAADGAERLVRGTWKPISGGVRETAVTSLDAGKTWQPWFDLVFRPHSSGDGVNSSADSDETIVARLDTEYQAAVKKNDAATMDRLLADDFELVTGSGKIYKKSDLLQEARSWRVIYERQEDTAQKVRVWGDAAVITAKLWAKGTENGKPFDYTLWFTDTYARNATGWCYVFGQSSLPLPKASK